MGEGTYLMRTWPSRDLLLSERERGAVRAREEKGEVGAKRRGMGGG